MANQKQGTVSLYAVGDVLIDRDKPESAFELTSSVLNEPDILFGQVETMYSERGSPSLLALVACRAHPRNVPALTFAGFDVVSVAGNHVLDWGNDALADTIEVLKGNGMQVVGAGKNIAEARKPVVVERKGVKVAFLAYNSILNHRYWADTDKPGCAPIRVDTLYEPVEHGQPGGPARVFTFAKKADVEALKADIAGAKQLADVVVLSLHWGIHFTPAVLAMYQPEVGRIAIDAGADLIIGHHAHILKGMEFYKGKLITYSLCNFAFDQHPAPGHFDTPQRKELAKFFPNRATWNRAEMPTYPFPADSRKTILVKAQISKKGVERVSFLPVYVNPKGQPEILTRSDKRFDEVVAYMEAISKEAGLSTKYNVEGSEVVPVSA